MSKGVEEIINEQRECMAYEGMTRSQRQRALEIGIAMFRHFRDVEFYRDLVSSQPDTVVIAANRFAEEMAKSVEEEPEERERTRLLERTPG